MCPKRTASLAKTARGQRPVFGPLQRRVSCLLGVHQLNRSSRQNCSRPPRSAELAARGCNSCGRNRSRLARPPAPGTSRAARLRQVSSCTGVTDILRGVPQRRAADVGRSPPEWLFLSARAGSRRRLDSSSADENKVHLETTQARFRRRAHAWRPLPRLGLTRGVRRAARRGRARSASDGGGALRGSARAAAPQPAPQPAQQHRRRAPPRRAGRGAAPRTSRSRRHQDARQQPAQHSFVLISSLETSGPA